MVFTIMIILKKYGGRVAQKRRPLLEAEAASLYGNRS